MYKLIGPDGKEYLSQDEGTLGGHKKLKIYGRLDCPSALRHIAKGNYVQHRVFFANERTALVAGYRPCGVCMKEHYKLWKENKLMTHAISIKASEAGTGSLCTLLLADGTQKTLEVSSIDDPSLAEYAEQGFELARFQIQGDYCVADLLAENGQWGRVLVWDYVQDRIVHLTDAPFARCSAVAGGQVVTLYLVEAWGHPADLWYSAAPLERIDPGFEPESLPLPLSAGDLAGPDCFGISVKGKTVTFQAGDGECRVELA